MNDMPPADKEIPRDRVKEHAHKELREMMENAIKFVALAILLLWARDHTHYSLEARAIFELSAGICFFPGAILRMVCVLTNPAISRQLIKEHPFLARRTVHKGDVYQLLPVLCFVLMAGLFLLLRLCAFQ
jgi:hypothetical protein